MSALVPVNHVDTPEAWQRTCLSKRRYSDELAARAVGVNRLRRGDVATDRLWTYQCGNCRGWHLTKRPDDDSAPITARAMFGTVD